MFSEEFCKKALLYSLFAALCAGLIFCALKYVVPLFSPFLIAFAIAYASRPLKFFIQRKTKMTSKASAITAVALILGLLIFVCFHIFNAMADELASIYAYLTEKTDIVEELFNALKEIMRKITDIFPFLDFSELSADEFSSLISKFLPTFTSFLGEALKAAAKAVPYAVVFTLVSAVSTFYFSVDLEKILKFASELFSEKLQKTIVKTKSKVFSAALKYIEAYVFIMLMTFTELYIGFSFLRLPYAFSLSFLLSVIDILPILGTGTVLIPWAICAFVAGDSFLGIGLSALYLAITVIRQFTEPKIIGKSIGLYPPLTLMGMYVGLKLFGVFGIFAIPFAIIVAKSGIEKQNDAKIKK